MISCSLLFGFPLVWLALWHFHRTNRWRGNSLLGYGYLCLAAMFLPLHPLLVLLIIPATVLIALGTHRYTQDVRSRLEGWNSSSGNKDLQ